MITVLSALYIYCGVCVFAGFFEKRYSLFELLVVVVMSACWPITLLGLTMYKFARFLNNL